MPAFAQGEKALSFPVRAAEKWYITKYCNKFKLLRISEAFEKTFEKRTGNIEKKCYNSGRSNK